MANVSYICNVNGVPITWFEIEMWHTDMLIKNRDTAIKIGDPYKSDIACEKIAHIIYNEMVQKITGNLGFDIDYENKKLKRDREHDRLYNKYRRPFVPRMSQDESRYHDQKWSSMNKFEEIMAFAKRKAYEQQYGKPPQPESKRYVPPPPEPPKIIEWKIILDIPDGRSVDERLIKVCFRKLARKYHPDMQNGDETKMKEIIEARNEAYKAIGKIK